MPSHDDAALHIVRTVVGAMLPLGKTIEEQSALERVIGLCLLILHPRTEKRADRITPSNPEGFVTVGMDFATARLTLKNILKEIGYQPEVAERGTITDLGSDQRLDLVIKMSVEMARGYGHWKQGQTESVLNMWPCQELYRAEDRIESRNWPERWREAGGEFYPGVGPYPEGRLIARKDSPIWAAISAFGQPFPPFDFDSGMDLIDVDREEAVELGVIEETDREEPQKGRLEVDLAQVAAKLGQRLAALEDDDQKHREDPLTYATSHELLEMAEEGLGESEDLTPADIGKIKTLVEKAIKNGFGDETQGTRGAYESVAYIYDALNESEKAEAYRQKAMELEVAFVTSRGNGYDLLKTAEGMLTNSKQMTAETSQQIFKLVELALAKGVGEKNYFRAKAHKILAGTYEQTQEPEKAEANHRQYVEFADGLVLLRDAKERQAALGKTINLETGAKISEMLSKAVERISESYPELHAEAYLATAEILEAVGDNAHAVNYYEYALLKNPKIAVKRRLAALKKALKG